MNCKKCGFPITNGDQFCKNCGEPVMAVNNVDQSMNGQVMNNQNMQFQQPVNGQSNLQYVNSQPNPQMINEAMPTPSVEPSVQQPWMNNYNQASPNMNNNADTKKGLNTKYIMIGLGTVICVLALVLIASMVLKKDNTSLNNSGAGSNNNPVTPSQVSNKAYKVNFKGFTLNIPDNLIYEEMNGDLYISDEEGTWVTILEVEQGSYATLKQNINLLQNSMQQAGYTCDSAQEKTIDGMDFITMEISMSGENAIAAITKANSMYIFGLTVITQDNDINYDLLKTFVPILNSAQYSETLNKIEPAINFDLDSIKDLAQ